MCSWAWAWHLAAQNAHQLPPHGGWRTWLEVLIFVSYSDTKETKISSGLWVRFKACLWYGSWKESQTRPGREAGCPVMSGKVLKKLQKCTEGFAAFQESGLVDSVAFPCPPFKWLTFVAVFCSDSGRGSSLLDRTIADRRQLNTITLPDFSDPETGENKKPEGPKWCQPEGTWGLAPSRAGRRPPGPGAGRSPHPNRLHCRLRCVFSGVFSQVFVHGGGSNITCPTQLFEIYFSPCSWSRKFETKIRLFPSPSSFPSAFLFLSLSLDFRPC